MTRIIWPHVVAVAVSCVPVLSATGCASVEATSAVTVLEATPIPTLPGPNVVPPSPVIAAIQWAPKESIRRDAQDGDNWPVTWADDDALYTTWGDGTGFVPKVDSKLSCGFARVDGWAGRLQRVQHSFQRRTIGSRPRRQKRLGDPVCRGHAVLVDGSCRPGGCDHPARLVARPCYDVDVCRLVIPRVWPGGLRELSEGLRRARDEFGYAYSHDDRADTPADRFILMREPKSRLRSAAWEFFAKHDGFGQPVWTHDSDERGAVFENEGACLRSAMTYCAPLKRYLWWQHIPQPHWSDTSDRGDTRFTGGFAVYDAPEPWGPWTTAYFTPQWDVGPGEHGDFPTKWISADGCRLHLAFSGDDCFSVRSCRVVLRGKQTRTE